MGPSSAIRLTRCDQRTTDVLVRQFNLYGTRLTPRPTNIVSLTQTQLWVPELCGEFGRGMAWPPYKRHRFPPDGIRQVRKRMSDWTRPLRPCKGRWPKLNITWLRVRTCLSPLFGRGCE